MKFSEFLNEGQMINGDWITDYYDDNFDIKYQKGQEKVFKHIAKLADDRKELKGIAPQIDWRNNNKQEAFIEFENSVYKVTKDKTTFDDDEPYWSITITKYEDK